MCNDVGQQLGAAGLPLSGGTLQTLLLHLMPTALTSSSATSEQQGRGPAGFCSLGRLLLRWKRLPPPPAPAATSSSGTTGSTSSGSSSGHSDQVPVVVPPGPEPAAEVTTAIELPEVRVGEGQLVVSVSGPPTATAGLAFPFTCQVSRQGCMVCMSPTPSSSHVRPHIYACMLAPGHTSSHPHVRAVPISRITCTIAPTADAATLRSWRRPGTAAGIC